MHGQRSWSKQLSRAQEIADCLARKQKNVHKGSSSRLSNVSSTSTPVQQDNSKVTSTIPTSISTVNRQLRMDQVKPKPAVAVDSHVVNVTTSKVCSVALPTFTAQVETSISDKSLASVSCLLDTAAQTSLISREVVDRLQIEPFKREYTTLVGFQMSRPIAKFYDVVRLKLIKPGYAQNITISCLVVDKTPAVCNMVGICQLAKKLQKRGADIADARLLNQKRDVLKNDILLGSDYYIQANRVNMPLTWILSTYLLNTIFG